MNNIKFIEIQGTVIQINHISYYRVHNKELLIRTLSTRTSLAFSYETEEEARKAKRLLSDFIRKEGELK